MLTLKALDTRKEHSESPTMNDSKDWWSKRPKKNPIMYNQGTHWLTCLHLYPYDMCVCTKHTYLQKTSICITHQGLLVFKQVLHGWRWLGHLRPISDTFEDTLLGIRHISFALLHDHPSSRMQQTHFDVSKRYTWVLPTVDFVDFLLLHLPHRGDTWFQDPLLPWIKHDKWIVIVKSPTKTAVLFFGWLLLVTGHIHQTYRGWFTYLR